MVEATAFHETWPGHHLQISLANEAEGLHPIVRYMFNSGFVEGWALYTERLLPKAAKDTMWTPFLQNYAYGWNVRPASPETYGYQRLAHSGGINGFSSMIIRVPAINVTAIVLSNNAAVPTGPIANDLLAIYFGQPYKLPATK